ncbi:MAG: hypothetical protein AAB664_04375, partial [Patescibacteria group bacterium]
QSFIFVESAQSNDVHIQLILRKQRSRQYPLSNTFIMTLEKEVPTEIIDENGVPIHLLVDPIGIDNLERFFSKEKEHTHRNADQVVNRNQKKRKSRTLVQKSEQFEIQEPIPRLHVMSNKNKLPRLMHLFHPPFLCVMTVLLEHRSLPTNKTDLCAHEA